VKKRKGAKRNWQSLALGGTLAMVFLVQLLTVPDAVRAATAVNDVASTNEDTSVTIGVLGNDIGSGLKVTSVGAPTHGTATIVSDVAGTIVYTPSLKWSGTDSLTYTVSEGSTLFYAGTGHYYEFVRFGVSDNKSWYSARDAAAGRWFYGMQGYLVTITSAGEQAFVEGKPAGQGWMGASDEPQEGTWRWVTGPEGLESGGLGRQFCAQTGGAVEYGASTVGGGTPFGGQYSNWANGEPNNANYEDHGHFLEGGKWNDYKFDNASIIGYVVEYGGMSGDTPIVPTATVTVNVNPVNDAPSFAKGANQTVQEDCGAQTVAGWATSISAGPVNESSQSLSFLVTNGYSALFSVQPAVNPSTGSLAYTPAPNQYGSVVVTVCLQDSGGTENGGVDTSAAQTFTVTVTPVNDAPSFLIGPNVSVSEDVAYGMMGWATSITAGTGDPYSQTLSFQVIGNSNPSLFAVGPVIQASGRLSFTTAANKNGTATITLVLHDNGGTANGGVDASAPQNFTITVTPVNDVPSFTKGTDQTALENCGPQTVAGWATSISAGPADEAGQALDFIVTNDNTTLFSTQPALAANGTLTYTSALNRNGTATVTIRIHDNGGTASGGVDTSAPKMFTIAVTAVNDPPVNTALPSIVGTTNVGDMLTASTGTWNDNVDTSVSGSSTFTYTYQWVRADDASGTNAVDIASATLSTYVLSDPDAHKYLCVRVTCTDNGVGLPAMQSVTLLTPWTSQVMNCPLSITEGASTSVTMDEDGSPLAWNLTLHATDADGDTLTWSISTPAFHGIATAIGTGTAKAITYARISDYNGSDSFVVKVSDGYGGSASITVNVTVREVNDAPTAVADAYSMFEDGTLTLSTAQLLSDDLKGPANESGQGLVLLGVGTTPVNCTATLNAGTVTMYPSPNFNGIASFDYTIQDNGTTAGAPDPKTASGIVTITVTPVNDVPSFTKGTDQTVLEDCGLQTVAGWASAISAGPADEAGQVIDFMVTNDNNAFFSVQPAIDPATSTLTFTPAANGSGTATMTVRIHDNGGTTNGGVDTSASQTFTITINAVNDPPVNTALPAIAGILHIGRTLMTTSGNWDDVIDTDVSGTSVLSYAYQWQRSTDGGVTFADIAGATGSSYTLTLPDNLQQVRVRVTCSDTGVGQPVPQSTMVFSLPVTILNASPSIAEGSAVSTSCDEDENPVPFSLTLHATDADEIDTLTWHIVTPPAHGNLVLPMPAVGSSTAPSVYHATANWNGSDAFTLRVEDRLTEFDNITVIITVNPRNDAPVNTVRPSIAGNLFVSHEVRAVIGNWNDSVDLAPGHLTYTYQWLRARDAAGTGLALIPGATASTYIVAPIDEGMYLAVRVICTDDGEGLPVSMSTSADSAFLPVRYVDMMPPTIELPDFSSWPGVTGASGGTAPSFTVSQLPFDLRFMVEDNRSSVQWKVSVNGVEASSSIGTGTIDRLVSLTEGTNPVDITAVDAAGNTASRHLTITLDTHAPVVTLARPLQSMVTGTTLNVEGTISDGVSGVRSLSIDGTEVIPYLDGMFTVSLSLKRGLNTIAVETLDNAGNHGSLTWVLDLTPVPQQHVRHTIDLTIDSAVMVVDGASVTMDAAPVIRENRTLLPLRAMIEELGGSITWNAKTRQATVKARGVTMLLTIGRNTATVNGKRIPIDPANPKVVPVILGSRTFLPLRFIAEQLGLDIAWYAPTRTVSITWEP
jgi:hypothetical protein